MNGYLIRINLENDLEFIHNLILFTNFYLRHLKLNLIYWFVSILVLLLVECIKENVKEHIQTRFDEHDAHITCSFPFSF